MGETGLMIASRSTALQPISLAERDEKVEDGIVNTGMAAAYVLVLDALCLSRSPRVAILHKSPLPVVSRTHRRVG